MFKWSVMTEAALQETDQPTEVVLGGVGAGVGRILLQEAFRRSDIRLAGIAVYNEVGYKTSGLADVISFEVGVGQTGNLASVNNGQLIINGEHEIPIFELANDEPIALKSNQILVTTHLREVDANTVSYDQGAQMLVTSDQRSQEPHFKSRQVRTLYQSSPLLREKQLVYRQRYVPETLNDITASIVVALDEKKLGVLAVSSTEVRPYVPSSGDYGDDPSIVNGVKTDGFTNLVSRGRDYGTLLRNRFPKVQFMSRSVSTPGLHASYASLDMTLTSPMFSVGTILGALVEHTDLVRDDDLYQSDRVSKQTEPGFFNASRMQHSGQRINIEVWWDRHYSHAARMLNAARFITSLASETNQ